MTFQLCYISTYTTAGVDIAYSTCTSWQVTCVRHVNMLEFFAHIVSSSTVDWEKTKAILVVLYQKMQYELFVEAITFLER